MRKELLLLLAPLALLTGCPEEDAAPAPEPTAQTETPAAAEHASAELPEGAPSPTAAGHSDAGNPAELPGAALVGQSAPDFTLTDLDGKTHTLSEYTAQGKFVVVEWFSPKCGAVNAYYAKPEFSTDMRAALAEKNAVWLAVNSSGEGKPGFDPAENKTWLEAHGKTEPVLVDADGAVGHKYGAKNTPHVFVIDPTGKVVYSGSFDEATGGGDAPKGNNLVLAAIDATTSGQPVAVPATNALG